MPFMPAWRRSSRAFEPPATSSRPQRSTADAQPWSPGHRASEPTAASARRVTVIFGASLLAAALSLATAASAGDGEVGHPMASIRLGRVRALFVSPHPDDATLGAGGLIQRVLHDGGAVRIVQ